MRCAQAVKHSKSAVGAHEGRSCEFEDVQLQRISRLQQSKRCEREELHAEDEGLVDRPLPPFVPPLGAAPDGDEGARKSRRRTGESSTRKIFYARPRKAIESAGVRPARFYFSIAVAASLLCEDLARIVFNHLPRLPRDGCRLGDRASRLEKKHERRFALTVEDQASALIEGACSPFRGSVDSVLLTSWS